MYVHPILPLILTSYPVPTNEKHPHSVMVPPPCMPSNIILESFVAVQSFFFFLDNGLNISQWLSYGFTT